MSDDNGNNDGNVVQFKKQSSTADLVKEALNIDFDDMLMVGIKEDQLFFLSTFEDRLTEIGIFEIIKMNVIMGGEDG